MNELSQTQPDNVNGTSGAIIDPALKASPLDLQGEHLITPRLLP